MSPSASQPEVVSPAHAALLQMVYGAQTAQVIYVAAKLGIADLLKERPKDVLQIAAATGVNSAVLRRIFHFLVSRGLLGDLGDGRFALTQLGQLLRSDRLDSVHQRAIFNAEVLFPLWGELLHSVTSGQSAATRVFGKPLYEHLAEHPETRVLFDRTMASGARHRHGPAVAAYDFSRFNTILDVGGGNGALLISILQAYPGPRGIVFDLPPAAERARQNIEAAGLSDRCSVIGGDALETVPPGADAYILSNFLIDMDDDRASTILGRCRSAMADTGTLLLIEWVVPTADEKPDPFRSWETASMDLIMLAIGGSGGGRVRTAAEFRELLTTSGFVLQHVYSTGAAVRVIEALPG
jgi:protein-L-isoaspartate O-methyltransferase